jgi:DNA-binding LytR/AlgR family response regulator
MTVRAFTNPTALIADDEPLLRESLKRLLAEMWPELRIVAMARNGRDAVESFDALAPDICFLDVHMPGLTGIEAARFIQRRAHIVFVTAYDKYAVAAFEQGALDYIVKPVDSQRLRDTVARLKARLAAVAPIPDAGSILAAITAQLGCQAPAFHTPQSHVKWLRVAVGQAIKLVATDELDFLRAEDKYTLVAWHDLDGKFHEGLIRKPLKELVRELDQQQFIQTHRAYAVNLRAISHVLRGENETANIHLKNRVDILPVSRTFLHQFRMM